MKLSEHNAKGSLIITATSWETSAIKSLLSSYVIENRYKPFKIKGQYRDKQITIMEAGMGQALAEEGISGEDFSRYSSVTILGYSGALDPKFKVGDVVHITEIYSQSVLEKPLILSQEKILGAELGTLVQTSHIVSKAEDKEQLFKISKCSVCDLESYTICGAILGQEVPAQVIKIILDSADMSLPHFNSSGPLSGIYSVSEISLSTSRDLTSWDQLRKNRKIAEKSLQQIFRMLLD